MNIKNLKIFGKEIIPFEAIDQMKEAISNDFVVKAALMPDSHSWYSLPIWGVVATKDVIVPAWVWYDIWCGMCAINLKIKKEEILGKEKSIFDNIYKNIPVSLWQYHSKDQKVNLDKFPKTKILEKIMKENNWLKQIGTLGGWNHFIEIDFDENNYIWIVIHSGSRGIWHKTASHYMTLAKEKTFSSKNLELVKKLEKEFDSNPKFEGVKKYNPEKYEELKGNHVEKEIRKKLKGRGWLEWHYGFDVNSKEGKDYIIDMNFCLEFALENRKLMIKKVISVIEKELNKKISINLKEIEKWGELINRNHNHAVLRENLWIHRKGATHSEKGMYWVIPGNMKDWSFIVKGKWNPDSLYSSSHWAWRVYWRREAKEKLNEEEFKKDMEGIQAKVEFSTLDESPKAYKNIFDVIDYQKDNIEVINY